MDKLHAETENRNRPRHMLTPYLLGLFIIWMSFNLVIVAALALGNSAVSPMNLFSAYADIFPGQSKGVTFGQEFSCTVDPSTPYSDLFYEDCRMSPATGTFSRIDVMLLDGIIYQSSFFMRENTLIAGDLLLIMESPNFRASEETLYFSWHGNLAYAFITPNMGRFSLFHYVWQVTLTDLIYPAKTDE
jgi:hypothetical protein